MGDPDDHLMLLHGLHHTAEFAVIEPDRFARPHIVADLGQGAADGRRREHGSIRIDRCRPARPLIPRDKEDVSATEHNGAFSRRNGLHRSLTMFSLRMPPPAGQDRTRHDIRRLECLGPTTAMCHLDHLQAPFCTARVAQADIGATFETGQPFGRNAQTGVRRKRGLRIRRQPHPRRARHSSIGIPLRAYSRDRQL